MKPRGGVMNLIVGIGVALLVAFGAGWAWGTAGKGEINRALRNAEVRGGLLEARSAVLDARVDIYGVNFGDASRHLEGARRALREVDTQLKSLNRQDDAARLESALTKIDEAQRMAGSLNQDANALAADAAKTIDGVLTGTPRTDGGQ